MRAYIGSMGETQKRRPVIFVVGALHLDEEVKWYFLFWSESIYDLKTNYNF